MDGKGTPGPVDSKPETGNPPLAVSVHYHPGGRFRVTESPLRSSPELIGNTGENCQGSCRGSVPQVA